MFLHVVNNIWALLCNIHYIENLPQVEAREQQAAAILKCWSRAMGVGERIC
jgi:hypothetical protein